MVGALAGKSNGEGGAEPGHGERRAASRDPLRLGVLGLDGAEARAAAARAVMDVAILRAAAVGDAAGASGSTEEGRGELHPIITDDDSAGDDLGVVGVGGMTALTVLVQEVAPDASSRGFVGVTGGPATAVNDIELIVLLAVPGVPAMDETVDRSVSHDLAEASGLSFPHFPSDPLDCGAMMRGLGLLPSAP